MSAATTTRGAAGPRVSGSPARGASSGSGGGGSSNRRTALIVAGAALLVVVVALLTTGGSGDDPVPLSTANNKPNGARGLLLLLRDLGHQVEVTTDVPGGEVEAVVVLQPGLSGAQRDGLAEFVDGGGRAVVVGRFGPVRLERGDGIAIDEEGSAAAGICDIASLGAVNEVRLVDPDSFFGDASTFVGLAGDRTCVGDRSNAVVLARDQGDGVVVAVAVGEIFTNRSIDEADNAVLSVGVIAPRLRSRVVILEPDLGDGGRAGGALDGGGDDVFALIPARVYRLFWLLTGAAVIYVASRGRRLGRVVEETLPANIEGSELVTAVGVLLERSKDPQRTAEVLRHRLRADLAADVGVDAELGDDALAQVVADRTAADNEAVLAALVPRSLSTDRELVALAAEMERVRRTVRSPRSVHIPSEEKP